MAKNPLMPSRTRNGRSFKENAITSSAIPVMNAHAAIRMVKATNIANGEMNMISAMTTPMIEMMSTPQCTLPDSLSEIAPVMREIIMRNIPII